MTRSLLFTILTLGWNIVWGQNNTFSVNGKIELDKGNLLVLTQRLAGMDTLAKAEIRDGQFTATGTLDEAVVATLLVEGYAGGFVMMLEPGVAYTATLTRNGRGDIRGGKLQEALVKYQSIVSEANAEMKKVKESMNEAAAQKHFKTAKDLQEKYKKVQQGARDKMENVIRKNADNVLGAYLQTAGMERVNELEPLKKVYESLSEKARTTEPGKQLAARIAALEQVGIASVAPDFTLSTPEGEEVSLYGVKGKLKIIDFWASWCGPCRMENPNMVKLYNDFKDKGLEVISVSLDERKAAWTQAIKKDGMPWIHVSDLKGWKGEVVQLYHVDAVPCILVLDENNRILAKNIRAEKLRAFVEERLK